MRTCELCESVARMYCESDQANLCWRCDEKVHRANFLVAKHSRSLLCHVCQSLTAWKASGPKLSPTVSVCDSCVTSAHGEAHDNELVKPENKQSERTTDEDDDDEYDDDYDDDDDDDDDEYDDPDVDYDEEDDENQVVPWSGDSEYPPTLVASSSCCSSSVEQGSLKRGLDFSDFYSDDEIGCSNSQQCSIAAANEEANSSLSSFRPSKQARRTAEEDRGQADSRSTAVVSAVHGFQKQMVTNDADAATTVLGIYQLSRDENR
ncbi:acidic repeat-containing protein-like isoform X2 [Mangifera indica]|uniref:acidic repeat-containing protein-like isoform X2 n=1 Tax=Mangifera indica TaxID=29780 RepID=UPI001CFBB751|nr:acidic repeat-containing protein-like isoform X2 [Mangifera indica]